MNKKNIGSFYTPKIIADFLVDYLSDKMKDNTSVSVLEPSAGAGSFIESIYNHNTLSNKIHLAVAVEREKAELEKVRAITSVKSLNAINADFLEFQKNNDTEFDLVVGNPPYFRKKFLTEKQIKLCEEVHQVFPSLSKNKIKNIWTAFLVRCIKFTNADGILAMVLPAELLQVKFAAELQALLLAEFERIEIFTFNELLFEDCKGQDTLLLIGERKSKKKGVYNCNIVDTNDLIKRNFKLTQNISIKQGKWTHSHLTSDERQLLENLKNQLKTVDDYCYSKAGIVTGANDYFIVDKETMEEFRLEDYSKKIIQKGFFVNGSVEINGHDFNKLIRTKKPTYLLDFNVDLSKKQKAELANYFKIGEEKKIHERYKTSIRDNWYQVPNVGTPSEAFFFKRCNEYPKLIKNSAKVLVTDSAYAIKMNKGLDIESLIYSFYNSLTLSFAELEGRFYGGGVLELTPNEFKILPIPYTTINNAQFKTYTNIFENKSSIADVCRMNDAKILKTIDRKIDLPTIENIFSIREKLYHSRIKVK